MSQLQFYRNAAGGDNRVSTYVFSLALIFMSYAVVGQIPMLLELYKGSAALQSGNMKDMAEDIGNNRFLVYLIIPFILSFAVLIYAVKYLHRRKVLTLFTVRSKFSFGRFFFAAGLWGIFLGLFLIPMIFLQGNIRWNFNVSAFLPLFFISVLLIPIQTTCEEVIVRGYLFQWLGTTKMNGLSAVIFTGVIFGLMHAANPEVKVLGWGVMVYYIGSGIFMGLIALMDDGLELSIGYHAMNNVFASLILTNNWQAFQTDALFKDFNPPAFGWDSVLTILVVQPLLLFIFAKRYAWKNWKEKLLS
jgi:membrane protease YdiL (CAAX protease family)